MSKREEHRKIMEMLDSWFGTGNGGNISHEPGDRPTYVITLERAQATGVEHKLKLRGINPAEMEAIESDDDSELRLSKEAVLQMISMKLTPEFFDAALGRRERKPVASAGGSAPEAGQESQNALRERVLAVLDDQSRLLKVKWQVARVGETEVYTTDAAVENPKGLVSYITSKGLLAKMDATRLTAESGKPAIPVKDIPADKIERLETDISAPGMARAAAIAK